MKKTLSLIVTVFATAHMLATGNVAHAAGTAAFSAAASPASVTVGSNTTFSLYENGDNVNVVTGTFSYDSAKLQFVSSSCAGSFSNTVTANGSSVSCYVAPGSTVSGLQKFASLTFQTIATGTANLTVTGSQIASAGVNVWNGAASSTTVSINAAVVATPTPAPTVAATTQPANNQSGKTSSTSTTKPSSTHAASATVTPTQTTTPTPESQVMGTEISNQQATESATPSVTPTPSQTVTQSTSSTLPWVAGSLVVISIAAAAAYWFFRKK